MTPYFETSAGAIYHGDATAVLQSLPEKSVHCCVTSPPYYGLRDYGQDGQIGLEQTPDEYVARLVDVFRGVWRVLRDDGTVWLNLGDSYAGCGGVSQPQPDASGGVGNKKLGTRGKQGSSSSYGGFDRPSTVGNGLKPKDLIGIPWRVAFALQADGWYLRQDIIWHKPNPMPESVTDRCTKAHEYVFLLSKSARYFYDAEAIKESAKWERWGNQTEHKKHTGTAGHLGNKTIDELPIKDTKNRRSVWTVTTQPFSGAHFATFPPKLIEPCILAGCPEKACSVCGSPWERVVERVAATSSDCPKTLEAHRARGGTGKPSGTVGKSGGGRINGYTNTIGVFPSCPCNNDDDTIEEDAVTPGTVLDIFFGSGTVGVVAYEQGRKFIGIDISETYLRDIAIPRIEKEGQQMRLF